MGYLNFTDMRSMLTACMIAGTAVMCGLVSVANADTLEDIKRRGKIIVATQAASPFFAVMDSAGKFKGSDIDVAEAYAKSLGVEIEFIPTTNDSRIAALKTGKVDVIFGALTMTKERAKAVQYSKPYEPNFNVVIGPRAKKCLTLPRSSRSGFPRVPRWTR